MVFSFLCDLCPRAYTLTLASHDPDGTVHDWLDDAIAVTVTDERSTAGVANLRAKVTVETEPRQLERGYLPSSRNVGASPVSVENPDEPATLSQLDAP